MITIAELRIGNWVLINGEPKQLNRKLFKHVILDGIGLESLEPIPLTEEILLEWGFENIEYNDYRHQKMIGTLTLYDGVAELHISDLYSVWINNTNQLQNLYFALTGEELVKTNGENK